MKVLAPEIFFSLRLTFWAHRSIRNVCKSCLQYCTRAKIQPLRLVQRSSNWQEFFPIHRSVKKEWKRIHFTSIWLGDRTKMVFAKYVPSRYFLYFEIWNQTRCQLDRTSVQLCKYFHEVWCGRRRTWLSFLARHQRLSINDLGIHT